MREKMPKHQNASMVVRDVLRTIQDEASGIWYWVSGQIDACEAHISSLKLRSGFSSLPDEVLLDVLEFVALEHTTADGVIAAATMLSHVCSRFRVLVVSSVHLWNRISPSMHSEAISTCFDRCGSDWHSNSYKHSKTVRGSRHSFRRPSKSRISGANSRTTALL